MYTNLVCLHRKICNGNGTERARIFGSSLQLFRLTILKSSLPTVDHTDCLRQSFDGLRQTCHCWKIEQDGRFSVRSIVHVSLAGLQHLTVHPVNACDVCA